MIVHARGANPPSYSNRTMLMASLNGQTLRNASRPVIMVNTPPRIESVHVASLHLQRHLWAFHLVAGTGSSGAALVNTRCMRLGPVCNHKIPRA